MRHARRIVITALVAATASSCLLPPRARTPTDVTGRLPRPDATATNPLDPVEAARLESIWKISMLEAARPMNANGFAALAAHTDPSVRAAAALAIGRCGEAVAWADGDATPFLAPLAGLSKDKAMEVRSAAAVALGLIGPPAHGVIEPLFAAETSPEVRAKLVRAAGRIAALPPPSTPETPAVTTSTSAELVLLGSALGDSSIADDAGFALGVYGLRCERAHAAQAPLPKETADAIVARFDGTLGEAREPFAYALSRLRIPATSSHLRDGLADPSPRIRALCARGLGAIPGVHATRDVLRLLRDSNVWTRVEAARAAAKLDEGDGATPAELLALLTAADPLSRVNKGLGSSSPHVAVAALEALGETHWKGSAELVELRLASDDPYVFAAAATAWVKIAGVDSVGDLDEVRSDRSTPSGWRVRRSIAEALASLKPAKIPFPPVDPAVKARPSATPMPQPTADPETPAGALSAAIPPEARDLFAALLADSDSRVAAAALDSYAELSGPSARARLTAVLGSSNDIAMLGTAADRLGGLGADAGAAAGPALVAAIDRLAKPQPDIAALLVASAAQLAKDGSVRTLEACAVSPDNALMLSCAKSLRSLGRTPPVRPAPASPSVSLDEFIAGADLTRATLHTSRGDLRLMLRPDIAPLMVMHLRKLSAKGFFKAGTFHRVVPGFVIQGGDPRGDGWGGSGESIPCELSDLPYERGAVGIALSARDTGDSQLFVTLTPQPHLEENYTVIGKVGRGEWILDNLEVGDGILDLTFD